MKTSHLSTQAILLFCLALFGCGSSSPENESNEPDEGARSETPASNPPQSDSSDNASLASESLEILNSIRSSSRRCGFTNYSASGPLTWNSKLETAANAHLKDMARNGFFEHTGSDGSSVGTRAERAGYDFQGIGENLAMGQRTLEEAFDSWINSPGHCSNLMDSNHREFGLATDGVLWVSVFGRSF